MNTLNVCYLIVGSRGAKYNLKFKSLIFGVNFSSSSFHRFNTFRGGKKEAGREWQRLRFLPRREGKGGNDDDDGCNGVADGAQVGKREGGRE